MRRTWLVVATVLLTLAGCGPEQEDDMTLEQRAEARAAEARGYVDDLADQLDGTGRRVTQDDLVSCDLSADDGLELIYQVDFTVEPGADARLRGEIADRLEADGWTVRHDPDQDGLVSVRFLRDGFSIGAVVDPESGRANAGGSGGCVR